MRVCFDMVSMPEKKFDPDQFVHSYVSLSNDFVDCMRSK